MQLVFFLYLKRNKKEEYFSFVLNIFIYVCKVILFSYACFIVIFFKFYNPRQSHNYTIFLFYK